MYLTVAVEYLVPLKIVRKTPSKRFHISGLSRKPFNPCETKGVFTPSVSTDSQMDASIDTWKECIDFNSTFHTKRQCQHQH